MAGKLTFQVPKEAAEAIAPRSLTGKINLPTVPNKTRKMNTETETPKELYPGHAAEVARMSKRACEIAEANMVPLPGPLLAAFTAQEMEAHGLKFRAVVHYDHLALQQIDSPFMRNMIEAGKPEDQRKQHECTDNDIVEFIYLFTIPARQVRDEIAKGRNHFRECALAAIADKFHPAIVMRLLVAAREHYWASWSTVVGYEAASNGEESAKVFTKPPTQQTA